MKLAPLGVFATIFLVSFSVQADNFLTANNSVNEAPVAVTPAPANNTAAPNNTAAEINSVPIGVTCAVSNVEAINSVVASAQTPQQAARLFAKVVCAAGSRPDTNSVTHQPHNGSAKQQFPNPGVAAYHRAKRLGCRAKLAKSWTFDCWQFASRLAPSTCRPHAFRSLTARHSNWNFLVAAARCAKPLERFAAIKPWLPKAGCLLPIGGSVLAVVKRSA
jgi:hypothetical protein